jgi:hypothetical protein
MRADVIAQCRLLKPQNELSILRADLSQYEQSLCPILKYFPILAVAFEKM